MADEIAPFPTLANLHERHYGLTEAIARNYAEGAAVVCNVITRLQES